MEGVILSTWLAIAKNEVRIWSNRFRRNRKVFFAILIVFLGIYAFFLVPWLYNTLLPSLIIDIIVVFGPLISPAITSFMFLIFLVLLFWPLNQALQDLRVGQVEVMMAAPIRPHHILFGKYVGRLPTYFIAIAAIAPWILGFFVVAFSIDILGQIVILFSICLLFLLSTWIGTLISSLAESRLARSPRGRDIGRAILFIVPTVVFIFLYLVFPFAIQSPEFLSVIRFFPSSWATNVILHQIGSIFTLDLLPALGSTFNVVFNFTLLAIVTFSTLILGYRIAGKAYSLEPIAMATTRIVGEKKVYALVRSIIPGSFGEIVAANLKGSFRRLEMLSRLGYAIIMSVVVTIMVPLTTGSLFTPEPEWFIFMMSFEYSIFVGIMFGAFVLYFNKDTIWLYRKVPHGIRTFVAAVFVQYALILVPIGMIMMSVIGLVLNFGIFTFLGIGTIALFTLYSLGISIGVNCIFPTFEEKGAKVALIIIGSLVFLLPPLMIPIFLDVLGIRRYLPFIPGLAGLGVTLFMFPFWIVLELCILYLGVKKLHSLE
ncbi:MAG: hypothetical protein ACFE7E_01180 [Candidatus Hodarchaeota archaeon]